MKQNTVYFLEGESCIKIGFSANPEARIKHLQTASSGAIKLLGTIAGERWAEKALHKRLAPYRRRGEWFDDHLEVTRTVTTVLREGWEAVGIFPPETESVEETEYDRQFFVCIKAIDACHEMVARGTTLEQYSQIIGLPSGLLYKGKYRPTPLMMSEWDASIRGAQRALALAIGKLKELSDNIASFHLAYAEMIARFAEFEKILGRVEPTPLSETRQ